MSTHGTLVITHRPGEDRPWHLRSRASNGQTGLVTQVYRSKRSAENAVLSGARVYGFDDPHLAARFDDERVVLSGMSLRGIPLLHQYVVAVVKYEEATS